MWRAPRRGVSDSRAGRPAYADLPASSVVLLGCSQVGLDLDVARDDRGHQVIELTLEFGRVHPSASVPEVMPEGSLERP